MRETIGIYFEAQLRSLRAALLVFIFFGTSIVTAEVKGQ
jgi:hypothetical protein